MGATETFDQFLSLEDIKKDETRVRDELSGLGREKERLLAELGRVVISYDQSQLPDVPFAELIADIRSVEEQENSCQQELARIEAASSYIQQRNGTVQTSGAPMVSCPSCHASVSLVAACCPRCGDDLSEVRGQYKRCVTCGAYYPAEYRFCVDDGGELVSLSAPVQEADSSYDSCDSEVDESATEASISVCPNCGEPAGEGDVFCGSCGTRLT